MYANRLWFVCLFVLVYAILHCFFISFNEFEQPFFLISDYFAFLLHVFISATHSIDKPSLISLIHGLTSYKQTSYSSNMLHVFISATHSIDKPSLISLIHGLTSYKQTSYSSNICNYFYSR